MLSADDYDAELAERYGWINRALPADALGDLRAPSLTGSPGFPLPATMRAPDAQRQIAAAMKHGLQTRDAELALAQVRPT